MRFRLIIAIAFSLLLVASCTQAGIPTIVIKSTRAAALNDGRDFHEIIAEVRDSSGAWAADGTMVTFTTTLGQFIGAQTIATRAGTARIRLVSLQKGTAN